MTGDSHHQLRQLATISNFDYKIEEVFKRPCYQSYAL